MIHHVHLYIQWEQVAKFDFFKGGEINITEKYIHNVLQQLTLLSFKTLLSPQKETPIHNQLLPVLTTPQLMATTSLHCFYEFADSGNFM